MPDQPVAATLARYICDFSGDDLPAETVRAAKEAVLDQFGIMLTGSTLPWTRPSLRVVLEQQSRPQSTVVGNGTKVSVADAAMVNSNYAHSCEFDDTGYSGGTHASSITVPTALANAEAQGRSGKEFVAAVVLGCEVLYMIGRVLTRPISELGFHAQSLVGPFGAATATAKMRGFDAETTKHALSITGSHASGTMEYDQSGGEVKRFHSGMAARAGVSAALLAEQGLTGPDTIFEGQRGLVHLFGRLDKSEAARIVADAGPKDWYAVQGRIVKAYPTVGTIPTTLQAVGRLVSEHEIDPDDIARIDVWINPHALNHGAAILRPKDTIGAQFSLAFSLGVLLEKGAIELSHYLDPAVREDERVLRYGDLLHVHGDLRYGREGNTVDWDKYWGARTRLTLRDGTEHEAEEMFRKGSPQNPLTPDELRAKFRSLAGAVLDRAAAEAVVDTVEDLESVEDMGTVAEMLTAR